MTRATLHLLSVLAGTTLVMSACSAPLCEGPTATLDSDILVTGGELWVSAESVDPVHADLQLGNLLRIGDLSSPAVAECRTVVGDIVFQNEVASGVDADVARRVPAFSGLEAIDGSIVYEDNIDIVGTDAFHSLERIEGGLRSELTLGTLEGFTSLRMLGDLRLLGTDGIAFENLRAVGGISLFDFGSASFPALRSTSTTLLADGDDVVAPALETSGTIELQSIEAETPRFLPSRIEGDLVLEGNAFEAMGTDVPAFVRGAVVIIGNENLDSTAALLWAQSIETIAGESERAAELGPIYVCDNAGDGGNCPGESAAE